jgi:hypothetical protein
MKTNFSDDLDSRLKSNNPHNDHQAKSNLSPIHWPTEILRAPPLGDVAAIIALSIAFCTLLLLTQQSPSPLVANTFDVAPRPIWISTIPYAPRDGLVPDVSHVERVRRPE